MLIGLFSPVPGIGHKIKSVNNPDLRVELVKAFAKKEFPSCDTLDYALAVEKVTSSKKDVGTLRVYPHCSIAHVPLFADPHPQRRRRGGGMLLRSIEVLRCIHTR